jgi:uncharacterized membrane protein
MNYAHIHLLINHLPLVGSIIGALILLAGLLFKSKATIRTGLITVVFSALTAMPVMFSGDKAEHAVENVAGIDETFIEEHEHAAERYIKIILGAGIVSLIAFFVSLGKNKVYIGFGWLSLAAVLVAIGFSVKVGKSGGEIRHPEIRKISTILPTTEQQGDLPADND